MPSPETAGLSFHIASLDESGLLNVWVSQARGQWRGTGGDVCGGGEGQEATCMREVAELSAREPGQGSLQGTHEGTRNGNFRACRGWKEEDQSQGFITFKRQSSFWSDCVLGVLCDVLS